MTIMQREMSERSRAIERIGNMMIAGTLDITPENESAIQEGIAAMIFANEEAAKLQDETFNKMPWLKISAERGA